MKASRLLKPMTDDYSYQHYFLRSMSTQFKLPELRQVALMPGMQAVYRVTYTPLNDVAAVFTFVRSLTAPPSLQVTRGTVPLFQASYTLDADQLMSFAGALSAIKFDHMRDQPNIPRVQEVSLLLFERGAGSFIKGVLLSPPSATDEHLRLYQHLQALLPDWLDEQATP